MTFWEKEASGRFKEEGMSHRRWREADLMDYLDGRLSPEKQAALRADMAQDRALRLMVKQLEQTVAFTRAVPLREAPRNYLLTPAMVAGPERAAPQQARGPQRRPLSLLLLRLTTAVTAIAFVVTVSLNLLPGGLGMGGATGKVASDQAVSTQEEAVFMIAEATPQASPTPGALGTPPPPPGDEEAAPNEAPAPMRMMPAEAAPTPTASQQGDVMVEELPPGMGPHPGAAPEGGWGVGGAAEVPETPMQMTQGLGEGSSVEDSAESGAEGGAEGGAEISDDAESGGEKRVTTETAEAEAHPLPAPTTATSETEPLTPVRPRRSQRQRWWLPGVLGLVTLLLGGATWWLSRRGA
jgi:hypothetical protein